MNSEGMMWLKCEMKLREFVKNSGNCKTSKSTSW